MAEQGPGQIAFGRPGIQPRWTHSNKQAVGTAYSDGSRLWFTLFRGVLTEAYYPTVDRPQLRDLQYVITDGKTFIHREQHDLVSTIACASDHALHFRLNNSDRSGRYSILKEVMSHPEHPCVLQKTEITGDPAFLKDLRWYVLCAPHLDSGGWGNNGSVIEIGGRQILAAEKNGIWLVVGATVAFSKLSCGYVGASDGWTDLAENYQMDWQFEQAPDGNVALTGELSLEGAQTFTTGIAFGDSLSAAATALFESLSTSFTESRKRFIEQWNVAIRNRLPLREFTADRGSVYTASYSLLIAHQDKTYRGAFIASLSIPWGEAHSNKDEGGYHYVWTRDMVNTASGLLAAGDKPTALRALIYLSTIQQADGSFPQNFWINGQSHWGGHQLDEVAFPVVLAWRLYQENALQGFDPYHLIKTADAYLVRKGPATAEERWEDSSGYLPSTTAVTVAALICAALFLRSRGEAATASFLEEYADFLVSHIEPWMVTTEGELLPAVPRHFIRILPVRTDDRTPDEDPNRLMYSVPNRPPNAPLIVPAKNVVDAGFLAFVRYGILKPDDPLIIDSLRVVDSVLKVDTPYGPCWRRYNHEGYGQRDDGGPFVDWGKGRAWPLLTGERGHYELAAGRNVGPLIRAMERFASESGLLPEQIWDAPDQPDKHLFLGRPTTSAMPLMWAHAEYVKLLRSVRDHRVFDFIPEVGTRYQGNSYRRDLEIWKPNRQVRQVATGMTLRIQAEENFTLHWSTDGWQTAIDSASTPTELNVAYVDISGISAEGTVDFTFLWEGGRWENHDYQVKAVSSPNRSRPLRVA